MSKTPSGNQQLLKELNKSRLLHLIYQHAPISRVDLAHRTGLSPTTVSSLIEECISEGFVIEVGSVGSGVGRKATLLNINKNSGYMIGIDLSYPMHIMVVNLRSEIIVSREFKDMPDDLAQLPDILRSFLHEVNLSWDRVKGIGVSVPGILSDDKKHIAFSYNLNLRNYPLHQILHDAFSIPVYLANDINAAAFAEQFNGNAKDCPNVMYVLLSYGVGAGLIINNEIYMTGENGNAIVDRVGDRFTERSSPYQHLYMYGIKFLSDRMREQYPDTFDNLSAEDTIYKLLRLAEDQVAPFADYVQKIAEHLAIYVANQSLLIRPDKVIVNGWICEDEWFYQRFLQQLNEVKKEMINFDIVIESAYWKEKGPAIGAAAIGLYQMFREMELRR